MCGLNEQRDRCQQTVAADDYCTRERERESQGQVGASGGTNSPGITSDSFLIWNSLPVGGELRVYVLNFWDQKVDLSTTMTKDFPNFIQKPQSVTFGTALVSKLTSDKSVAC